MKGYQNKIKKVAITGGKGGTGKSTMATALARELGRKRKILLVDADVDCPNDDIILGLKTKKIRDVANMIPVFNEEKCIKCGRCARVCREKAIAFIHDNYPILVPDQCTGCGACEIICPEGAISRGKQKIGDMWLGESENEKLTLVSGRIRPGVEESSLVVNAVKKYVSQIESKFDLVIIDTAAGTHCPVIAALIGVDLALAVTEPTPLGNHDLGLILELLSKLGVQSKVIINRSDIADQREIVKTARDFGSEILAEVPYSKQIQEDYAAGRPISHPELIKLIRSLK